MVNTYEVYQRLGKLGIIWLMKMFATWVLDNYVIKAIVFMNKDETPLKYIKVPQERTNTASCH
jgi:hypothetical protein